MEYVFPKALRLLRRGDFLKMEDSTCQKYMGQYLRVTIRPNGLEHTRLGITASRRYGKAVQRNRFKRLIREAFRLNYSHLSAGFDLLVKPRQRALTAELKDIQSELIQFCAVNANP